MIGMPTTHRDAMQPSIILYFSRAADCVRPQDAGDAFYAGFSAKARTRFCRRYAGGNAYMAARMPLAIFAASRCHSAITVPSILSCLTRADALS